jgi:hypothetical protein
MPLILEDRVRETTTVTGLNDATLLGAVTGFQAFSVIGNGNTTYYTISDQAGGNWETGIGTFNSIGPTLVRTTVLDSSAGGAKVSFPAGTKDVFVTYPSDKAVYLDASGDVQPALGNVVASQVNITGQGDLRLQDTTGGQFVALQAPGTIATSYTLTLPVDDGTTGQVLTTDGSGVLSWTTDAGGDVVGPASATDNAIARFDLTTGKIIQNSVVTIADTTGNMAGVGTLSSGAITTTGVLTVPAGTVSAPAITTTGDTNTGIFFPAADTIAFAEGGVEAMRINSNGDLCVKTTTALLSDSSRGNITLNGASESLMCFGIGGSVSGYMFSTSGALEMNAAGSRNLLFVNNSTERMRIDSSGNVGIGTSSPGSRLTLQSSGGNSAISFVGPGSLIRSYMGVTEAGNYVVGAAAGETFIRSDGVGIAFSANTGSSVQMRIDSSGNVGIATTSPSTYGKFVVLGASTNRAFYADANAQPVARYDDNSFISAGFTLRNTGVTSSNQGIGVLFQLGTGGTAVNSGSIEMRSEADYSSSANQDAAMAFATVLNGTNTERMRITSTGEVGIGATATNRLNLTYNNASGVATVGPNSTGGSTLLTLGTSNAGTYGERMRIDSSGNVGIGTSSPTNYGAGYKSLAINGTSSGILELQANGTTQALLVCDASDLQIQANGSRPIRLFTNSAERMRIDSSGNVGIGTNNPASKLDVQRLASLTSSTAIIANVTQDGNNTTGTAVNASITTNGTPIGVTLYGLYADAYTTGGTSTNYAIYTNRGNVVLGATSGNVGIGTSSPSATLDVSSATGIISRRAAATTEAVGIFADSAGPTVEFYGGTAGKNANIVTDTNAISLILLTKKSTAPIVFSTNSAERMRIDSAGNVGIGTTSPQTNSLTISKSIGNSAFSGQSSTTPTAADQRLFLFGAGSDADPYKARMEARSSAAWTAGTSTPTYLTFFTTPSGSTGAEERMRIDSSGNLLVRTTSKISAGTGMALKADAGASGSIFEIQHNGNPGTNRDFIRFYNISGTEAGSIEHNATSTVAYLTSSDYRLKENILPMVGGLDKVLRLKPVTYTWKEDKKNWQGFIAHELQEVVPECVSGEKDAVDAEGKPVYQGIDTSFLVATLTAAIQELKATVDAQAARIAALENN